MAIPRVLSGACVMPCHLIGIPRRLVSYRIYPRFRFTLDIKNHARIIIWCTSKRRQFLLTQNILDDWSSLEYSWVHLTVRRTTFSDKRFLSKGHHQILNGDIFYCIPFKYVHITYMTVCHLQGHEIRPPNDLLGTTVCQDIKSATDS